MLVPLGDHSVVGVSGLPRHPRCEEVPRHSAQRGLDLARQDRIQFGALCDDLVDQRLVQRVSPSGLVGGSDIRSPGCSHVIMVP